VKSSVGKAGIVAIGLTILALAIAPGAGASFPGRNGKIAYVCEKGSATVGRDPHEICTVTPGSAPVRLTRNAVADVNPDFSAGGRLIAFEEIHLTASCHSPICGNSDIYTIRSNGRGIRRITHTASVSESDPAFSPSGKAIAYTKDPFKGNPKIVVIRVSDGKVLRTLGPGIQPSWSPNGKRIAFSRLDHYWSVGVDSVGSYSIWTMSAANGSSKSRLTSITEYANGDPCTPLDEGCPETNGSPAWAPAGGSIAWDIFDSKAQNGYLYRMTGGGGVMSPLVPFGAVGLGCPQDPAWSPDQAKIVFSDGTYCNPPGGNPPSIWVRPLSGGSPIKVAAGSQPDWGPKP
jgi:Tol biopolymer transport system component